MGKRINHFFDRLEDHIRNWLSHWPILYAVIGGIGVVLFWRGVWHTADFISAAFMNWQAHNESIDFTGFPDGPISFFLGMLLLLMTGLFVSNFIGNEILISGLRREKKITEKTEKEVESESGALAHIRKDIHDLRGHLEKLEGNVNKLYRAKPKYRSRAK